MRREPTRIHLDPIWSCAEVLGDLREAQKRGFESSKLLRGEGSTHVPSIAGEMAAAMVLDQPMDATLLINGDRGWDLPDGTDVKTVTRKDWPPYLKEWTSTRKWAKFYALVWLDLNHHDAWYIGRVTASQLKAGRIRNFGHGDNYTLSSEEVADQDYDQ